MFCQKEEIDHVLGIHKGARDHLVSTETQAAQARCTIYRLCQDFVWENIL